MMVVVAVMMTTMILMMLVVVVVAQDPDRRTSYSWRDDTNVVAVLDAFYDPERAGAKEFAENWQVKTWP
jgi:hypothetical protein